MDTPPVLFFIRHGETDWNRALRYQGHSDIPLNETGRGQARRNGEALRERMERDGLDPAAFDFVASPLGRAQATMEIVRAELGLPPQGFRSDARLLEINFGSWNGMTAAEMGEAALAARAAAPWTFLPPQGESYEALHRRVGAWVSEMALPTVCVAHGGVARMIRGILLGLSNEAMLELTIPQDRVFEIRSGREEAF